VFLVLHTLKAARNLVRKISYSTLYLLGLCLSLLVSLLLHLHDALGGLLAPLAVQ